MADCDVYITVARGDERHGLLYDHIVSIMGSVSKQSSGVGALFRLIKTISDTLPPASLSPSDAAVHEYMPTLQQHAPVPAPVDPSLMAMMQRMPAPHGTIYFQPVRA